MAPVAETAAERFAACLRGLKERSGRSYGQLAQRLHMSTSTLHRYCSGAVVPVEYGPVERMARLCGATPEEVLRLHRLWVRADEARGKADVDRSADTAEAGAAAGHDGREPADGSGDGGVEDGGSGDSGAATDTAADTTNDDTTTGAGSGEARLPAGEPDAYGPVEVEPSPTGAGPPSGDGHGPRRGAVRSWIWPVAAVVALAVTLGVTAFVTRTPDGRSGSERRTAAAPRDVVETSAGRTSPSPSVSASAGREESAAGEASPSASRGGRPTAPAGPPQNGEADEPDGSLLTWTARSHVWQQGCGHRYLLDRPASQIPPPPVEQDARSWATALGAVHGGETVVEVTVRAAGKAPVVIEEVYVRVAERREPLRWSSFSMDNGCGGALTPAAFQTDLDAERPVARPRDGYDGDDGTHLPATRLPYQVSAGDPLVLRIEAQTEEYDCDWYLEVRWSSGGRSGALRIDDHGEPFRTSGTKGRPGYAYAWDEGAWQRS